MQYRVILHSMGIGKIYWIIKYALKQVYTRVVHVVYTETAVDFNKVSCNNSGCCENVELTLKFDEAEK